MKVDRAWRVAEPPASGDFAELAAWPWPMCQLLYNRGLRTAEEARAFLESSIDSLLDPHLMCDMDRAVERILAALHQGETIGVYGDFDADGLTATALLKEVLESPPLGGRVVAYLPHRSREGYGLNLGAVSHLRETGVGLMVTADCGIGADAEIQFASTLGMDVIVTDHHTVPEKLPPAYAVINPRRSDCGYPFKDLAGVGVAYKLCEAILDRVIGPIAARAAMIPRTDLVAIGTVADLASLTGENRVLVKHGLEEINHRNRPGLRALMEIAGLSSRTVDSERISYNLAPRLNAAGRMGDAKVSLDLLTTTKDEVAAVLAEELERFNQDRQAITASALGLAREQLMRLEELPPALVVDGDYPSGIVGLVAGKLAEEYRRPAFVIERGEAESRGSGRGVIGFNVVKAVASASDLLLRYGGHPQAAGFALKTDLLPSLRARLEAAASEQLGAEVAAPELAIDASIPLSHVGPEFFGWLQMLEPFGVGNPRPVFCTRSVRVRDSRVVGNRHLKVRLGDGSGACWGIGFGMAAEYDGQIRSGTMVDCAYTISRNERDGMVSFEVVLRDLDPH